MGWKKWGKSIKKTVKNPGKAIKKVASESWDSIKETGSSLNKEIRRGAKSVGDEILRHPEDYLTMGMTAYAREGAKGLANVLTPDINIDTDNGTADLLREQQIRAENANADLSLSNVADIVGGGTAQSLGGIGRKKKKGGRGPATSLGINT